MLIVAGHLMVEPDMRARYLAGCVAVVEQARRTRGCRDFTISADLVDTRRINDGPTDDQSAAIMSAFVSEYDVAGTRRLT
jgi:hypothetical protein